MNLLLQLNKGVKQIMKRIKYPNMLPGVNYDNLDDDEIFGDRLVDLEYETMSNLSNYIDELKNLLLREKMIQTSEIMTSYLCAYLGFFVTVGLGKKQAEVFEPIIKNLIETHSRQVYKTFLKYKINQSKEKPNKKLQTLREDSPGSIVAQTMRLGRVIGDTMEELRFNQDGFKEQTEWFCPQDNFLQLLVDKTDRDILAWKDSNIEKPILYAVNQTIIQIAWLMGYFAYLDKEEPTKYLEFGLPLVQMYGEAGEYIKKRK